MPQLLHVYTNRFVHVSTTVTSLTEPTCAGLLLWQLPNLVGLFREREKKKRNSNVNEEPTTLTH